MDESYYTKVPSTNVGKYICRKCSVLSKSERTTRQPEEVEVRCH
jgi:hypothetical protein